jgi:hypothetical protein
MSYNQAFTGCFCECHFNGQVDKAGLIQQLNLNNYYGSLLQQSLLQLNYAQQICNLENYPHF